MHLQNQAHFHVDYTCKIVQLCNNAFYTLIYHIKY